MCILPLKDSLTYIDLIRVVCLTFCHCITEMICFACHLCNSKRFCLTSTFCTYKRLSLVHFISMYLFCVLFRYMDINNHHCLICTPCVYLLVRFILRLNVYCNGMFHLCTLILFNSMLNSLM